MKSLERIILEGGLGRQEIPELVDESRFETELELDAYHLAREVHKNQYRKEGNKEYITHLVAVWWILKFLDIKDPEILAAGLLHDTIEDTGTTKETIVKMFGERVFHLIEGVSELTDDDKEVAERKTKERTLRSSGLDYGVSAIKFADRLHNTKTLAAMSPEKRMIKARHTLDFVVDLAMVYKMWDAVIMLQDLSFPYAYPDVWEEEAPRIAADPRLRAGFIEERLFDLKQIMQINGITGEHRSVFGGFYRSYQSLLRSGADYKSVNDLLSIEAVLPDEASCYKLLGCLHQVHFEGMVPNAFRDYLYARTFDGYSALQTTIHYPGFGLVKYVITTRTRSEYNHKGVLATAGSEGGQIYRAKLVLDSDKRMVVLPENGTVLDAAVALYPHKVASAIGFEVDGEIVDPSSKIGHGGVLTLNIMGRDDWLRFEGIVCSPVTNHVITEKATEEDRRLKAEQGKEKMDMYLRASRIGLFELEDLVFINGKGRDLLEKVITNVAGNRGTLADFYFALSRDYGVKPDEVVDWLRDYGFSKEKLGLATIYLEVNDRPGLLHCLTGIIGEMGSEVNINQILQTEKRGQKGVTVLKLIVIGLGRGQEESLSNLLQEKKEVLKVVVV